MKFNVDGVEKDSTEFGKPVQQLCALLEVWISEFAPVERNYLLYKMALNTLQTQLQEAIKAEQKIQPVSGIPSDILKKA